MRDAQTEELDVGLFDRRKLAPRVKFLLPAAECARDETLRELGRGGDRKRGLARLDPDLNNDPRSRFRRTGFGIGRQFCFMRFEEREGNFPRGA